MIESHDTAIIVIAVLSGTGLFATVAGFIFSYFREGRARAWQLADAKALADKVTATANEVAAENLAKAGAVAQKQIDDAVKLAQKVHDAAEVLANKVAENTAISTQAAMGAKDAFSEANTVNVKIRALQEELLKIGEHVIEQDRAAAASAKERHDEAEFAKRVRTEVEEHLKEMNGRARQFRPVKKKRH